MCVGLVALTVIAMAVLRWPLFWTCSLGLLACVLTWRKIAHDHCCAAIVALSWSGLVTCSCSSLSLLAVGGAVEHRAGCAPFSWWSAMPGLADPQFNASIASRAGRAGPRMCCSLPCSGGTSASNAGGPGAAGWALGLLGILVCMVGVMLPSSLLTWQATRWGHRNRNRRSVRAFKQGMAPVVIGLLLATAWVLDTRPWP